jgi:drug/metabolite transporter (DMT)-like permease
MCSAVTALLGAVLLGHHVGKAQWAGAALILGGIVTLNV